MISKSRAFHFEVFFCPSPEATKANTWIDSDSLSHVDWSRQPFPINNRLTPQKICFSFIQFKQDDNKLIECFSFESANLTIRKPLTQDRKFIKHDLSLAERLVTMPKRKPLPCKISQFKVSVVLFSRILTT